MICGLIALFGRQDTLISFTDHVLLFQSQADAVDPINKNLSCYYKLGMVAGMSCEQASYLG